MGHLLGTRHSWLSFIRCAALVVVATAVWGCGGPAAPKTLKVKGTVKFDGQPLSKGQVSFQSMDGGDIARPATGTIGSDGTYELSTFADKDGALPGNYKVTVTSYENSPTAEEFAEGAKLKSNIPEKYSSTVTTDLTATIPKDGPEPVTVDLDLKK